jgi:hypothetical protein
MESGAMKGSPAQNIIAIILGLGVLVSFGVRIWATQQLNALVGPDFVSSQGETVCLHLNRTLYLLSSDGALREQIPLSSLGIKGHPSDLQMLDDGDILFGDLDERTISRCSVKGSTRACRQIAPSVSGAFASPFKFFLEESTNLLYITDTDRHRLLVQDMESRGMREIADGTTLKFPNGVRAGPDGLVRVADTNHHRVLSLRLQGSGIEITGPALPADTEVGRSGHTWPLFFCNGPQGDWWVLNADAALKFADLVVYDFSGKALRRIPLPKNAGPASIARAGGKLVVTDVEYLQVRVIDPSIDLIGDFGDSFFQGQLKEFRENKKKYWHLSQNALRAGIGFGIAVFGLGFNLIKSYKRRVSEVAGHSSLEPVAMSQFPNVHWLEPNPRIIRRLSRINWFLVGTFLALMLLCGGAVLYRTLAVFKKPIPNQVIILALMVAFLVATMVFSLIRSHRGFRGRLGSDGKMLYLADHSGKALRASPEEVVYTDSRIAFGRFIVFTQLGLAPLFSSEEFDKHIRPLLERAQKIGGLNMSIYHMTAFKTFQTLWFFLTLIDVVLLVIWATRSLPLR